MGVHPLKDSFFQLTSVIPSWVQCPQSLESLFNPSHKLIDTFCFFSVLLGKIPFGVFLLKALVQIILSYVSE